MKAILNNELMCVANVSFYPDRSHLISSVWFALIKRKVSVFGDITPLVLLEYSHYFAAETYGVLAIMIAVHHILVKYNNSSTIMTIIVN